MRSRPGDRAGDAFEKPLQPTKEKVGIIDGFGCFPEKVSAAKNIGEFVPDDFEHEIATNYVVKGKGLVVLTSCSHRGVINTVRQAQAASGVQKVHAVIGGFHIVPPLGETISRGHRGLPGDQSRLHHASAIAQATGSTTSPAPCSATRSSTLRSARGSCSKQNSKRAH